MDHNCPINDKNRDFSNVVSNDLQTRLRIQILHSCPVVFRYRKSIPAIEKFRKLENVGRGQETCMEIVTGAK